MRATHSAGPASNSAKNGSVQISAERRRVRDTRLLERLRRRSRPGFAAGSLTPGILFDKLSDMDTNVSELLRNFPKIRRAALAGERVVIHTREGNLVLTAERPVGRALFGSLAAAIDSGSLTEADSGADESDWDASL